VGGNSRSIKEKFSNPSLLPNPTGSELGWCLSLSYDNRESTWEGKLKVESGGRVRGTEFYDFCYPFDIFRLEGTQFDNSLSAKMKNPVANENQPISS